MPPGDPRSVSLDASYHKEHEYNIISQKPFRSPPINHILYGLLVGIRRVSVILGLLRNEGVCSHRDPLKPIRKLHIHIYHYSNVKTIRPVVTENSSGQNLGRFWHAPAEHLSPPF